MKLVCLFDRISCFKKYSIEKDILFETSLISPPSTNIYCTYELEKKNGLVSTCEKRELLGMGGGEGGEAS
jgi:hypothetical protein